MATNTTAPAPLWWSDGGNLRCRAHLPLPGSASWWADGWSMMRPEERERLARTAGQPSACEICAESATGAHAEYLTARAKVADAITALVAHLDELDEREDIERTDWSFAGTVNHVATVLRELVPAAAVA